MTKIWFNNSTRDSVLQTGHRFLLQKDWDVSQKECSQAPSTLDTSAMGSVRVHALLIWSMDQSCNVESCKQSPTQNGDISKQAANSLSNCSKGTLGGIKKNLSVLGNKTVA